MGTPKRVLAAPMRRSQQAASGAAASAGAGNGGDGRDRDAFERVEQAVDSYFVVESVLSAGEFPELGNVGARRECLFVRSREHQDFDGRIRHRLLADFCEALVHPERECVARLGAIEGDAADAVAYFVQESPGSSCYAFLGGGGQLDGALLRELVDFSVRIAGFA